VLGKAFRLDLRRRTESHWKQHGKGKKPKGGMGFKFRQPKKRAAPPLKVVRPRPDYNFYWHLEQVRRQGNARDIKPPLGTASWRTFTRAANNDPALKAALDRARQDRKDSGWIRRRKVA